MNHEELARFTVQIARGAGDILIDRFQKVASLEVRFKRGDVRDLVTVADTDSEAYLRRRILARFPDDGIIGEEQSSVAGTSGTTWIMDPLDGTTNFVHGVPNFAVSIGVVQEGRVVVGVVHCPVLRETFHAHRGGGAFLNGKPIRVSSVTTLEESLVCTGFADVRSRLSPNGLPAFNHMVTRCQAIRRMGAAAIDLSWVAAGRFEAFWEVGLASWDVCAGSLLVEEAGGRITDMAGGDQYLEGGSVVVTNGTLHEAVLHEIGGFPRPPGVR